LIAILLLVWQIAAVFAHSMFFPTPLSILAEACTLWLSDSPQHLFLTESVFRDVLPSLGRMMAGWGIAVVAGMSVGFTIGRSRAAADLVTPAIEFLRALPSPALIPVFLVLFGTETQMRIILIAFGSVWPVLLNTIDAVRSIDPVQLDLACVLRLPRRARIIRVILPSALPKIFAGIRVALSTSVILMVVSELVASTDGIGNRIANAQELFQFKEMWAGIVLLALIGLILDAAFSALEARVLHWHRARRLS
jgi:ABC-type nitrate/sulfonate/bicarbonate transport system permease component